MKARNYIFTVINILVAGLPIGLTWDLIAYLFYLAFVATFIALTAWNTVGDYIAILIVFRGKRNDKQITHGIRRYLELATINSVLSPDDCKVYWTESTIAYLIPISQKRVVMSKPMMGCSHQDLGYRLFLSVPKEAYDNQMMLSRKVLLISIVCYVVVLRLMELWAIVALAILRFIFSLVTMIVTGALFEGFWKIVRAIMIGISLGTLAWKINKAVNFLQDKALEILMKQTKQGTFDYLEESGRPEIPATWGQRDRERNTRNRL